VAILSCWFFSEFGYGFCFCAGDGFVFGEIMFFLAGFVGVGDGPCHPLQVTWSMAPGSVRW